LVNSESIILRMVETAGKEKEKLEVGGLEGEDVWGDDADDPMDGITGMSDAELVNKTRDLESSIRRIKQNCSSMTNTNRGLDARIAKN
jgi:hypothetical protein